MDSKACSCSSMMIQWIPIPTAILLGFCCFFGCGFDQSILTSIALISSTALFVYSKQITKKKTVLKSNEHETPAQQSKDEDEEDEDEELEEDRNGVITSEDSEVEWPFSDEGSISDEDSLIEIAIPTGHYVGYKQRMPKKMVEFSTESIFQRSNVMDEEDNLIEIDISMGLIKCSRY